MSSDEKSIPPMWTAVQVNCCQSKVFRGYISGISDGAEVSIVLYSVPEGKITFILGWAIEKIEVSSEMMLMTSQLLIFSSYWLQLLCDGIVLCSIQF